MKRRVRLTESQLRGIVEESSRRVIQEMIDEGWFGDTWDTIKSGLGNIWGGTKEMGKGAWNTLKGGAQAGFNALTAPWRAGMNFATNAMNGDISKGWNAAKNSLGQDWKDMNQGLRTAANGTFQGLKGFGQSSYGALQSNPGMAMMYNGAKAGKNALTQGAGYLAGKLQNNQNFKRGFNQAQGRR